MDRRANEALKERLRRDAVDPAKAEERRITIAAKQAKRMRGVVVETKRKKLSSRSPRIEVVVP